MPFFNNQAIADIQRAMKIFSENYVVVGIPQDHNQRDDDSPLNNATIGYLQHTGFENVPPRPWLFPVFKDNEKRVAAFAKKAIQQALQQPKQARQINENTLNTIGLFLQGQVRKRIADKIPPPLSERTIAEREQKRKYNLQKTQGFDTFTPLVDTGNLVSNITYALRKA